MIKAQSLPKHQHLVNKNYSENCKFCRKIKQKTNEQQKRVRGSKIRSSTSEFSCLKGHMQCPKHVLEVTVSCQLLICKGSPLKISPQNEPPSDFQHNLFKLLNSEWQSNLQSEQTHESRNKKVYVPNCLLANMGLILNIPRILCGCYTPAPASH